MSFASSLTSHLRRVPGDRERPPGFGRSAIVAHLDRWFAAVDPGSPARAALIVIDVDIDDALPTAEAEAEDRRRLLGTSVEHAVTALVRPGDSVSRVDAGRFAVLRGTIAAGGSARTEAAALARGVEDGLVGRPEGYGVRVTAGAATLAADAPRAGRQTLGTVTAAMLQGKLMSDDRVVVVLVAGD